MGGYFNPTTIWTPQGGWANGGNAAPLPGKAPAANPFMVNGPNGPMQDPSATGQPSLFSNNAGTTGILNPFGLTKNMPEFGYFGVPQAPQTQQSFIPAPPSGAGQGGYGAPPPIFDNPAPPGVGTQSNPLAYHTGGRASQGPYQTNDVGAGPQGSAQIPGVNGYMVNGQWIPFSQANITPTPPPTQGSSSPYGFLQGVTSGYLDPLTGQQSYAPTNPSQFANPITAQAAASMYGLQPWQLQLGGPGMGFSQPMQMFGPGTNAGLAVGEMQNFGSAPGSYGNYLVGRDLTGSYGPSPWDTKTTGANSAGPTAGTLPTYTSPTTTGGGSLTPTTPNIFNGPAVDPTASPQGLQSFQANGQTAGLDPITALLLGAGGQAGGGGAAQPLGGTSLSPDQWLASNGGSPTDATPAWASMVAAMQRNVQRGGSDLQARFAGMGGRFSSDYGTAMTDYYNQANLNQNSLLGQMQLQSSEAAAGRNQAGISQLSSQDFQSLMQASGGNIQGALQAMQLNSASGQADLNRQLAAATQFMQLGYGGSTTMAQLGAQGAQGMYGTETSAGQQEIQRQLLLQQLGLSAMTSSGQLGLSNLSLGNTIGQGQFTDLNQQSSAAYQEWLRQQPQYNPLLQMMYGGATAFPPMYQPQYAPSNLQSILGAAGSILGGGGLAALINLLRRQPGQPGAPGRPGYPTTPTWPPTGPTYPPPTGPTYPGGGGGGGWPTVGGGGNPGYYPPFIYGWPQLGGVNGPGIPSVNSTITYPGIGDPFSLLYGGGGDTYGGWANFINP